MQLDAPGPRDDRPNYAVQEGVLTRYKAETRRKEETAEREYEKGRNKPSAK